jgi:hypothetical protein
MSFKNDIQSENRLETLADFLSFPDTRPNTGIIYLFWLTLGVPKSNANLTSQLNGRPNLQVWNSDTPHPWAWVSGRMREPKPQGPPGN